MKNVNRIITGIILMAILIMTVVGCSIERGVEYPSPMTTEQMLYAHEHGDHRYCDVWDVDYNDEVNGHACVSVTCNVNNEYLATVYDYHFWD